MPAFLAPLIGAALGFIMSGGIQDVVNTLDADPTNNPTATDWLGNAAGAGIGGVGGAAAGAWAGAGAGQIGGMAASVAKPAFHPPANAGAIKPQVAAPKPQTATVAGKTITQADLDQYITNSARPANDYNMVIGPKTPTQQTKALHRTYPVQQDMDPPPAMPDMVVIDESGTGNRIPRNITMVPNIPQSRYPGIETPETNARINTANPRERNLNVPPQQRELFDMDTTPVEIAPGEVVNTYMPMSPRTQSDPQSQRMLVEWAKQMQSLGSRDPNLARTIDEILSTFGGR